MNQSIASLAGSLYSTLLTLSELPFVGSIPEYAELNEQLAESARKNLHDFLTIHSSGLDEEWTEILKATATFESFQAYVS